MSNLLWRWVCMHYPYLGYWVVFLRRSERMSHILLSRARGHSTRKNARCDINIYILAGSIKIPIYFDASEARIPHSREWLHRLVMVTSVLAWDLLSNFFTYLCAFSGRTAIPVKISKCMKKSTSFPLKIPLTRATQLRT